MSILVFAYACEPNRGSEPGAGWDWVRLLATLDETCVITRANNAEVIEAALPDLPERDRLSFEYVDLPRWARFWKKGPRGTRIYYLLWQLAALATAKRLQRDRKFDVVWHLTLANLWMGSLAPLAGGTFVFGPAGGGAGAPLSLLPSLGIRGATYEIARSSVTAGARYLNPLARLAWRRADLMLVQNPESLQWLPARHRHKAEIFPNALVTRAPTPPDRTRPQTSPTLLYAGRLLPFKGVSLALRALELLPEWRLVICGSGPDERRLRRLALRADLQDRIEFRGWVDQEELARVMREEADVFVFPSLHDQAPLVVAEATTAGLPVVCLNRGGAKLLGGRAILVGSPEETVRALAEAIRQAGALGPGRFRDRSEQTTRLREIVLRRTLKDPDVTDEA